MKYYFLFAALSFSSCVFAQENNTAQMPRVKDFNTWSLGLFAGPTIFHGDISSGDDISSLLNYGVGIRLSKACSHSLGIEGRLLIGGLQGKDTSQSFSTNINYEATLNGTFSFGNISFLNAPPNLNFYLYAGGGLIQFAPIVKDLKTGTETKYYNPTTERVVHGGFGMRYKAGKSVILNLEYGIKRPFADKADGKIVPGTAPDYFSHVALGISYIFGKKEKAIEFTNPLESMYQQMEAMQQKMDSLARDSDKDGVADLHDKENNTPEGTQVYGNGTSVDTDSDGIMDANDEEPFSGKGAKVDEKGKEIDSDMDGVPDSRDLEANTEKDTLVNFQGKTIPVFKNVILSDSSMLRNDSTGNIMTVPTGAVPKVQQLNGIVFRVQVLAMKIAVPLSSPFFKGLRDLSESQEDGYYKYVTGTTRNADEASATLKIMISKGFSDAFIATYEDGKRLTADQAHLRK